MKCHVPAAECHVLSWSALRARLRQRAPALRRAPPPGRGSVVVIHASFRFGSGGPFAARNARPRARPSARVRAGAVCAPDCAREPQDTPLPCVSQEFFETGAAGRSAPGKRLRTPLLTVLYRYIFFLVKQNLEQKVKYCHDPPPTPSCPDSFRAGHDEREAPGPFPGRPRDAPNRPGDHPAFLEQPLCQRPRTCCYPPADRGTG